MKLASPMEQPINDALRAWKLHIDAMRYEMANQGKYVLTEGWGNDEIVNELEAAYELLKTEVTGGWAP